MCRIVKSQQIPNNRLYEEASGTRGGHDHSGTLLHMRQGDRQQVRNLH